MKFQFQNNDFEPCQNTNVQQLEAAAYTITGVYVSYIREVMNNGAIIAPSFSSPRYGPFSGQASSEFGTTGALRGVNKDVMILDDSSLVNSILKWPSFGGLC